MPRVNNSDEVFKKAEQIVDRPQATKHNIADEYLKHPPQNLKPNMRKTREGGLSLKEGVYEREPDLETTGGEGIGREKQVDALAEIAHDDDLLSSR